MCVCSPTSYAVFCSWDSCRKMAKRDSGSPHSPARRSLYSRSACCVRSVRQLASPASNCACHTSSDFTSATMSWQARLAYTFLHTMFHIMKVYGSYTQQDRVTSLQVMSPNCMTLPCRQLHAKAPQMTPDCICFHSQLGKTAFMRLLHTLWHEADHAQGMN